MNIMDLKVTSIRVEAQKLNRYKVMSLYLADGSLSKLIRMLLDKQLKNFEDEKGRV